MDDFYESFDSEMVPVETGLEEITPTDMTALDGNIKISADLISTIAGIAAAEIPGVHGMYSSIPDTIAGKLGAKKNRATGVKVEIADGTVMVDLYIVINYGFKIRQVAESVQESVKNNIETMTGMKVIAVNIHIESVNFQKKAVEETSEIVEFFDE